VRVHKRISGRSDDDRDYWVSEATKGRVRVSMHEGASFGTTMPRASLPHFKRDLAGVVKLPPSGNPAVDAVTSGKAKLLGKGDDGIVFRVGRKTVKVSTTVPYQPMNPGHRSPAQAANQLKRQTETSEAMRAAGVPGLLPSTYVRHGDKGFQIKPYVTIPKKLTLPELEQAQRIVVSMHKHGFALNDSVQVGKHRGKIVMFDTGKADKLASDDANRGIYSSVESDMDAVKRLYDEHGHRGDFVRLDYDEGERAWSRLSSRILSWLKDPEVLKPRGDKPSFAEHHVHRAADKRREVVRRKLRGADLKAALEGIDIDEMSAVWEIEGALKVLEGSKMAKSESGWEPAPNSKKGAMRKRKAGGGYTYRYDLPDYKMRVTGEDRDLTRKVQEQTDKGIKQSADICKVTPSVCRGNLGIPRADMPQLEQNVVDSFLSDLQKEGVKVEKGRTPVGHLKATQREINAEKVEGMAKAHEEYLRNGKKGWSPGKNPIIISKDNYVLDGHHRWAAMLTIGPGETMPTVQVDLPMKELLSRAKNAKGVTQADFSAPSAAHAKKSLQASVAWHDRLSKAVAAAEAILQEPPMNNEDSFDAFDLLKAGGWESIPGGRKGGRRRRKAGGGYEYDYGSGGKGKKESPLKGISTKSKHGLIALYAEDAVHKIHAAGSDADKKEAWDLFRYTISKIGRGNSSALYKETKPLAAKGDREGVSRAVKKFLAQKGMKKSMSDFGGYGGKEAPLPAKWLRDYLDAFIEEAYEHEYHEAVHRAPRLELGESPQRYMAQCVYHELVARIPKCPNLMRAAKQVKADAAYIESALERLNLSRVNSDNYEAWRTGEASRGMALARSMDTVFTKSQEAQPLTINREAPAVFASEQRDNPFALLAKAHDHIPQPYVGLPDETLRPTVANDCPVHNSSDLTKAGMFATPMLPCTCGR